MPESVVRDAELFVAVDVEGGERGSEARVRLASAIDRSWLDATFPGAVVTDRSVGFDGDRILARTVVRYHDLVLDEEVRAAAPAEVVTLLARAAAETPYDLLGPRADVTVLATRLGFLARTMPELAWPAPDALVRDAVMAIATSARSVADVRRADVCGAMTGLLTHAQRAALDVHAPAHWTLPSGRRVPVVYTPERAPVVAARIQELFGLAASPRLGGGRVAMLFELLAPTNARCRSPTTSRASGARRTRACAPSSAAATRSIRGPTTRSMRNRRRAQNASKVAEKGAIPLGVSLAQSSPARVPLLHHRWERNCHLK